MKKFFKLIGRETPEIKSILSNQSAEHTSEWPSFGEEEGQLAVDIYQTEEAVIVKSTIAGAVADDIEISLAEGMLTIKGRRELPEIVASDAYLYQECYWGRFSRSIVLPIEVKSDKVCASLHNGVLTISLPKARRSKQTTIRIRETDDKDYD
ncbi:MAG TPA: Hsp20/alpha crystallin family protein [bacterium]|jgi:HSP20 family protein|nr:Hsp20/alpha crystallin family protein [bacterium]